MGWRGFGFVHRSRTIFCRAVPNLSITIRNFFIAVRCTLRLQVDSEAAAEGDWGSFDTEMDILGGGGGAAQPAPRAGDGGRPAYGDEKVANREIRVWHGATENGP